jgi:hypothetical protein
MIEVPEELVKPEVELSGIDGNVFVITGVCIKALERAGNPTYVVDAFVDEAESGDYDHALQTAMAYCDVT